MSDYQRDDEVLLASIDESAPYEVDEAHILRNQKTGKYVLRTASGCSCWYGDYDEEEFATLDELEYALVHNPRDYNPTLKGAEQLIAEARETEGK